MELLIIGVDCSLLPKRNEDVSPHPVFAAACNPVVVLAVSCGCHSEQSPIKEKAFKMFFEVQGWHCLVCVSKHFSSLHSDLDLQRCLNHLAVLAKDMFCFVFIACGL